MSATRRWKKTAPYRKDPDGKMLCRGCGGRVPVGRATWCSKKCVDDYLMVTSSSHVRWLVEKRDKGICARCGCDTVWLFGELTRLFYGEACSWRNFHRPYARKGLEFLEWLGIPWSRFESGSLWDADHIVPVVEGGGLCGLENYRTLCIPCHRQATRELRRRLAQQRKQAKQPAIFPQEAV